MNKPELTTQFDNALGQMSKEITNLFPEGTGYVRLVPNGYATAGGISIQMDNLWTLELGYLEDEVFDSDHKFLIRIESTKNCLTLTSSRITFDLNLDGALVYADVINTYAAGTYITFDAGNNTFYNNAFDILCAYSTCSEEQLTEFVRNFLRSWNRTLSSLRAVITQAAA